MSAANGRGLCHDPDRGPGHGHRGSLDHGPCPSGGHVQSGPDRRPSTPQSTARHRDEAPPIQRLHMVAESNNLHATCNGFPPDTNSRLSTQTQDLVLEG